MLATKYGMSVQQAAAKNAQVSALAAEEGLDYHLDQSKRVNTFDAHRLIHLAATHGLQDAMKERLLHAYFTDGLSLGETDTLVQLAAEVGLDAEEARTVLTSTAYADEVRGDERRARLFGVRGVPFFAIDEKYGVSGAQPAEVFSEVLEQVWPSSIHSPRSALPARMPLFVRAIPARFNRRLRGFTDRVTAGCGRRLRPPS